ncbi:MAG: hypothetical protein OWU33_09735 [Firmicutes bacterium]|nr:hypothetical protein [Bacillota bacterium]
MAITVRRRLADYVASAEAPQVTHREAPEARWIGLGALVLSISAGAYLTLGLHYMSYDAVARVAHAFFVLWSRDPHLGAIGFVWTPLSSILALPLVALYPLWPALVRDGLAGIPVSALFLAAGAYYLSRLLARFGMPLGWRVIITSAYALNPLILLYGANGMTDVMMSTCVIATYFNIYEFLRRDSLRALMAAALWLVVGLGVRYEALPFGIMVTLGLAISQAMTGVPWVKIRGTAILLLSPLAASGALWLYFNWLIMKNPLYFLDGTYSNIALTSLSAYEERIRLHEMHHILRSLWYVTRFTLLYWPIDVAILVGIALLVWRRSDRFLPVLFGGIIGPLLLDLDLLYKGNLAPWDRYFIYYIPSGLVLVSYLGGCAARHWVRDGRYHLSWLVATLFVVAGSVGTYFALQSPKLGNPDGQAIRSAIHAQQMNPFTPGNLALIRYVNAHPHMLILADDFTTGVPVVIQVNNPQQFIITSDYDYKSILLNPRGRVSAFLVPQPVNANNLVDIDRDYPGMWYGKVPWAHFIAQFNDVWGTTYRLYAIGPTAP